MGTLFIMTCSTVLLLQCTIQITVGSGVVSLVTKLQNELFCIHETEKSNRVDQVLYNNGRRQTELCKLRGGTRLKQVTKVLVCPDLKYTSNRQEKSMGNSLTHVHLKMTKMVHTHIHTDKFTTELTEQH